MGDGRQVYGGSATLDKVKRLHAESTGRTSPQTSGRPQTLAGQQQQYSEAKRRNQAEAARSKQEEIQYNRRMEQDDRDFRQRQQAFTNEFDKRKYEHVLQKYRDEGQKGQIKLTQTLINDPMVMSGYMYSSGLEEEAKEVSEKVLRNRTLERQLDDGRVEKGSTLELMTEELAKNKTELARDAKIAAEEMMKVPT